MTRMNPLIAAPEIDSSLYREVLGHYPTNLTVVTVLENELSVDVRLSAASHRAVSYDQHPALPNQDGH